MRWVRSLLALVAAAGFCWLFVTRYWLYRDCIEAAASSCITPDGENLIAGGALWIVPAIICLIVAALARPR